MFEGTITAAPAAGTGETTALRALAWGELVAKLGAARDLRALLSASRRESLASFAPQAARALELRDNRKEPVNPDALAAGKTLWCKPVAAAHHAAFGDREMR